jgi:hypothetical protein
MSASLYLANSIEIGRPSDAVPPVLLHSNGYYWFLYRYFESANLERHKGELIDLYGGGIIEGYQLHRLKCELEQALADVQHKPASWKVLAGWTGTDIAIETEDWKIVEKTKVIEVISSLLALACGASDSLKLVCDGD